MPGIYSRMNLTVLALVEALRDSDPSVRSDAAAALGELGPDASGSVLALVRAASDPHPRVRRNAVASLGEIDADPAAAVPVLVDALRDPELLRPAIEALARFGAAASPAIPALRRIRDGGEAHCNLAAWALKVIGPASGDARAA